MRTSFLHGMTTLIGPYLPICSRCILNNIKSNNETREYTGVDTFVKECYDKDKLVWIPNRMSFMMQNAMGGVGSKDDDSDKKPDPLVAMAANIEALGKQVGALVAWSGEVKEKLGMD